MVVCTVRRLRNPDGFKWTCCGGQADAPGCQADDDEEEGEEEEEEEED
jgi:hypothetical protein